MLDKSLIGRQSEPVLHEVEKGAIRRFAEALGDPNPLALDEVAARAAGYPGLVAPADPHAALERPDLADLSRFALSDAYLELRAMLLGWT